MNKKVANDFFNSFKKEENLNFNFVNDVGTVINDSSVISKLKENIEIIEIVEDNIDSDKYIYEIDNIKNISEKNKVGRIVFYYAKGKIMADGAVEAVSSEKVKQKYYELYGSNVNFVKQLMKVM